MLKKCWTKLTQLYTDQPLIFVLIFILLTRVIVLLGAYLAPILLPSAAVFDWTSSHLLAPLLRWDTAFYSNISNFGYSFDGDLTRTQTIGFFPLYPLLVRMFSLDARLNIEIISIGLNLVLLTVALLRLWDYLRKKFSIQVAWTTIALVTLFPTSLFFSTMYTEALFLFLTIEFIIALDSDNWLLASIWAGFASGTKITGAVFVFPLLAKLIYHQLVVLRKKATITLYRFGRLSAVALLSLSGLLGFLLYQWIHFGDPLIVVKIQHEAWLVESFQPWEWVAHLRGTLNRWDLAMSSLDYFPDALQHMVYALDGVVAVVAISLCLLAWIKLPRYLASLGSVILLFYILTLTNSLLSMTRYVLINIPLFITAAIVLQSSKVIKALLLGVLAVMLLVYSAMFAQWYWVG